MTNTEILRNADVNITAIETLPRFTVYTIHTDDVFATIAQLKGLPITGHAIMEPTNDDKIYTYKILPR